MKTITGILFSSRLTAAIFIIFALSIAAATFIENDFGSETARAHIYNATWFELLFLLAIVNLLGNMILHKVYRKSKLSILVFHVAFILVILGAGITRYTGFTGIMHIREGLQSSMVLSDEAYLNVQALSGDQTNESSRKIYLSGLRNRRSMMKLRTGNGTLKIQYLDHMKGARPVLNSVSGGRPAALLVASTASSRDYYVLYDGESRWIGDQLFHMNRENPDGVALYSRGDSLFLRAPYPVTVFRMREQSQDTLGQDTEHYFQSMSVYGFGSMNLVLSDFRSDAEIIAIRDQESLGNGKTALSIRLKFQDHTKDVTIWRGGDLTGELKQVHLGENEFFISYGSVSRVLPFSLYLEDFLLERYPGSESPSSFESRVILEDEARQVNIPHRIYMNNILDYEGYRFYQSAYDTDELGTILSVNRDRWGTIISYLGYFFLFSGILLSLINPGSRFRSLGRQLAQSGLAKKALVLLVFAGLGMMSPRMVSARQDPIRTGIPAVHAGSFGELLVQDFQGRIKPLNTLASEALRKVSRRNRLKGSSPEQVMLGMLAKPLYWQSVPLVRVSDPEIQSLLDREDKYASFTDFFTADSEEPYRLLEMVQAAHSKKSSDRSKFDTEILRIDERVNICYMIYTGEILRILPARDDPAQTWHSPGTIPGVYSGDDSLFATNITHLYLGAVESGMETGDWSAANEYLDYIKIFQERMGGDIMPTAFRTKAEILYNKINVFERLARFYFLVGITLLLIQLINILGSKPRMSWLKKVLVIHLLAGFGVHTLGLAVRWYVSGHAPWSNGYESLIYISWATMLAGAMFSRRNATPLAATAVLSWIILHTAHLSWMDPQMTNLVPVLKSYWLTIHVAVIASSYGFLGLAALMGFLNLVLMALQTGRSRVSVKFTIQTLSSISEMTIIAGLGLLTIGTFLGGIWANESWGRYWAWDAKESWALVTIMVYAFIAHMRFVPGLKSTYTFNLASLLGYASVLMTYFGVNYYLSGMHSYAAGDPVPVPNFVWYTLGVTLFVSLGAYRGELKSRLINNLDKP